MFRVRRYRRIVNLIVVLGTEWLCVCVELQSELVAPAILRILFPLLVADIDSKKCQVKNIN